MARLASETQMAFYPTNEKSLEKIFKNIKKDKNISIIDPCCGNGDAVKFIADILGGATTYGIELDEIRAKNASLKIKHLLNADALLGVRKSLAFASLLFLNPPYGIDSNNERLEIKFVKSYANVIVKGGFLLLVINNSSATLEMAKALKNANLKPICAMFDEESEDFKNYGQFFLLFEKMSHIFQSSVDKLLNFITQNDKISVNEANLNDIFIPTGKSPTIFKEIFYPIWKYNKHLEKSKAYEDFEKNLLTATLDTSSIEYLNEGQKQFLLASGAINEPLKENEQDCGLILKGTVKKITNVYESENVQKTTQSFQSVIYGLDLNLMEFVKYE